MDNMVLIVLVLTLCLIGMAGAIIRYLLSELKRKDEHALRNSQELAKNTQLLDEIVDILFDMETDLEDKDH